MEPILSWGIFLLQVSTFIELLYSNISREAAEAAINEILERIDGFNMVKNSTPAKLKFSM